MSINKLSKVICGFKGTSNKILSIIQSVGPNDNGMFDATVDKALEDCRVLGGQLVARYAPANAIINTIL